jgi:ATP-dependent helicase/nuclease subunit A
LGECAVELQAIPVAEQTYPEEAAVVAQRIKELLDGSHFVRDKENGLRTIVPEDIVILLRSPKSVANYYVKALEQLGIPCTSGSGDDLLQSRGVSLLRAMLQVVQNPRLDIPLANVLMSPLFAFSADDMACIRAENPMGSLYEAVINSTSAKANSFKAILHKLREEMKLSSLSVLIEKIMEYTHLDSIFAAMHDGEISVDHLNTFYLYAVKWEQSGQGSLNRFLEHLDSLEEKGTK